MVELQRGVLKERESSPSTRVPLGPDVLDLTGTVGVDGPLSVLLEVGDDRFDREYW